MNHGTMIPLNDMREMKRSNSRGSNSDFELEEGGLQDTLDYRLQAVDSVDGSKKISLWHDISLVHLEPGTGNETDYHNFVCEIPKFSRSVTGVDHDSSLRAWKLKGIDSRPICFCFRASQEEIRDRHIRSWQPDQAG